MAHDQTQRNENRPVHRQSPDAALATGAPRPPWCLVHRLKDVQPADGRTAPRIKVRAIRLPDGSMGIQASGYGDHDSAPGSGTPVILENRHGSLYLLVWADINREAPTHEILMDGAQEANYRDLEDIRVHEGMVRS